MTAWRLDALCAQIGCDEDLWFPVLGDWQSAGRAKAVCAKCPVRAECLTEALENDEEGIWGGTTTRERYLMRRATA